MATTIQIDTATGLVCAVVDHGNYDLPAVPNGRTHIATALAYDTARAVCGSYYKAANTKCYTTAAFTTEIPALTAVVVQAIAAPPPQPDGPA